MLIRGTPWVADLMVAGLTVRLTVTVGRSGPRGRDRWALVQHVLLHTAVLRLPGPRAQRAVDPADATSPGCSPVMAARLLSGRGR